MQKQGENSRNAMRQACGPFQRTCRGRRTGRTPCVAGPEEPSLEERASHEITHLPYQPWCAWCVMEKGRAKLDLRGERDDS